LEILSSIEVFLETGLVYSILAMGYYVSYTILDFPDLTVEGTFLSGAVAFGLLVTNGISPWLALLAAFAVGCIFGTLTGVLHVVLKIRSLLCGILVSTALISVNLVLAQTLQENGSSSISFGRSTVTLINRFFGDTVPININNIPVRQLVLFFVLAIVFKLLLDVYFKTKNGLLLRAAGNNEQFVKMLGVNPGINKVMGLAIGNGYAAVAGALYCHISGAVNQSMGIGVIVIGLASLIIGLSVFSKAKFMQPTTKVVIGAIIYQAALTVVLKLGVPSAFNKLIMAVIFTLALVFSQKLKKKGVR